MGAGDYQGTARAAAVDAVPPFTGEPFAKIDESC
jgi:hypothetical protein